MQRIRIMFCLTLLLAGCGRGLPQVTPTVAPSPTPTVGSTSIADVPTQTPIIRLTSTATLTLEASLTPTPSPLPTQAITETPTPLPATESPTPLPSEAVAEAVTLTPTWTPSPTIPTNTPTATFTPRPTNTATATRTPSATFTPSLTPTVTLTPFFSATPTLTNTPSNTPRPTNTPTFTPTRPTATRTPELPSPSPNTSTPAPTNTPRPTNTPTPTVTLSPTPSLTFTLTPGPTATPSLTSTRRPTITSSPTETNTPSLPTNTQIPPTDTAAPPTITPTLSETPTLPPPTFTSTLTFTPSAAPPTASFTPTAAPPTLTPTFDLTESALIQLTLIRQGQLTQTALPSWTPIVTSTPTRTLPAPTLDVTPLLVTATPGGPAFPDNLNGITSTPEIVANIATLATDFPTQVPTPTALPPDIIQRGFPTPIPAPRYQPYSTTNLSTYRFNFAPGSVSALYGIPIMGSVVQFAPNPLGGGSFVSVDQLGLLRFAPPGGSEGPVNESPFFDGFGTDFTDREQNKNFVSDIGWAPNGQQFFFIVNPPGSNPDKQGAGLWFWQPNDVGPGRTFTLLVDCLPGYTSCGLVANRPADSWRSLKAQWSSDSSRLLVTLTLPGEGRQALTVVSAVTDHGYKTNAPDFARYDYGYWTRDGRIVVSGRDPNGTVIVGVTDGNFGNLQVLLNASSAGLWMRDAFMRPDGSIVAFGREGGADGPVRLYLIQNGSATPLSDFIGAAAPGRIDVTDDGSQAVVSVEGTQYTVNPNNGSFFATELRAAGYGPPGGFVGASDEYPTGVLPNSRYAPGQQVQMIDTQRRNVRNLPGTANTSVIDYVDPNEYVGILAGPYTTEGLTWWYVSTARNQQGWFAGQAGDVSFLNP